VDHRHFEYITNLRKGHWSQALLRKIRPIQECHRFRHVSSPALNKRSTPGSLSHWPRQLHARWRNGIGHSKWAIKVPNMSEDTWRKRSSYGRLKLLNLSFPQMLSSFISSLATRKRGSPSFIDRCRFSCALVLLGAHCFVFGGIVLLILEESQQKSLVNICAL